MRLRVCPPFPLLDVAHRPQDARPATGDHHHNTTKREGGAAGDDGGPRVGGVARTRRLRTREERLAVPILTRVGHGGLGSLGASVLPQRLDCRIRRARWRWPPRRAGALATPLGVPGQGRPESAAGAARPRVSYSTGVQHQGAAGAGHRLGIGAVTATVTQPPLSTCTVNTHGASGVRATLLSDRSESNLHTLFLSVSCHLQTWDLGNPAITKAMRAVSSSHHPHGHASPPSSPQGHGATMSRPRRD